MTDGDSNTYTEIGSILRSRMVWKKSKRSGKGSKKLKSVPEEAQPKLKSCLKKRLAETTSTSDQESSQEESYRISGDGSSCTKEPGSVRSLASRSLASTNCSRSVESRNSGESTSLQQKASSADQMSFTDESSNGNALSSQHSERSARSNLPPGAKKKVRFNAIQIRDYERVVGDNPSCTSGPPLS
jgi:hypothetical protein